MNSDLVGSIVLLCVCLVLSFLCSATETAITAAGRMKLKALASSRPERKRGLEWLESNMQTALTVTLVVNNIVNIAASTVAAIVFTDLLGVRLGPPVAVAVMSTAVVIFCEILPKNIAIGKRDAVVCAALAPLRAMSFLLKPIVVMIQGFIRLLGGVMGWKLDATPFVTREDIEVMVTASEESGALEEDERKMISGVISFEETRVSEAMVARTDMDTIASDMKVVDAVKVFLDSGHSRVPVFSGELDKIVGVIYVKDILPRLAAGDTDATVSEHLRQPLFIPETVKTSEAFEMMKKSKVHIAIVVDEYGGTAGLVTLEDLIEEIVGDIQDEYDDEMPDIMEERDGVYIVQGNASIEDLSEELKYPFESSDVDTVAGMMLTIKGNFLERGESVTYGIWRLTATEVSDRRIVQVRIERMEHPEYSDDADEEFFQKHDKTITKRP